MKKFFSVLFAVLIMMFSAVSAFAVESPEATVIEATTAPESPVKRDPSPTSPQTGSNDFIPYAIAVVAIASCGAAVVKLAKSK